MIVSNEVVLELEEARQKIKKTWRDLLAWVLVLSVSKPDVGEKGMRIVIERLRKKKQNMSRDEQKQEVEELLSDKFKLPQKRDEGATSVVEENPEDQYEKAINECASEIGRLVSNLEQSDAQVDMLTEVIKEQSASRIHSTQQAAHTKKKSEELQTPFEELGKFSTRNVNKRIKCRDEMSPKLTETLQCQKESQNINEQKKQEMQEKELEYGEVDEKNEIIMQLNSKLDSALETKTKAQKLKRYYKEKLKHGNK